MLKNAKDNFERNFFSLGKVGFEKKYQKISGLFIQHEFC